MHTPQSGYYGGSSALALFVNNAAVYIPVHVFVFAILLGTQPGLELQAPTVTLVNLLSITFFSSKLIPPRRWAIACVFLKIVAYKMFTSLLN